MNKEILIENIKVTLKEKGFRKQQTTWRNDLGEIIAVLSIQSSQWDDKEYYINLGIYIKELGDKTNPPHNQCQVQFRIDHQNLSIEQIMDLTIRWFADRSDINQIQQLAPQDSKTGLVMKNVYKTNNT